MKNGDTFRDLANSIAKVIGIDDKSISQQDKDNIEDVHRKLINEAYKADRKQEYDGAIRKLDDSTSKQNIKQARVIESVRCNGATYLPIATNEHVLPTWFVRSPLFPSGLQTDELTEEELTISGGETAEVSLKLKGARLQSYDRCVLAACLSLYNDQALGRSIETTIGKIVSLSKLTRGTGAYLAVNDSLHRLSKTSLIFTRKCRVFEINPIVEIEFDADKQTKIEITIRENIAQLYKANEWRRFHPDILKIQGLAGWLAAFYSSHSKPFNFSIKSLYTLTGLKCKKSDFVNILIKALESLKNENIPIQARVESYLLNDDKTKITVKTFSMRVSSSQKKV